MKANRREFLASVAAATLLRTTPSFAEEARRIEPPYLRLKRFIPPGLDEFAGEKTAEHITSGLHAALRSGKLANAAVAPSSYRPIAPDLKEALFQPPGPWMEWVHKLGKVRRAQFYPLPGNVIRFEVAGEREYRTGFWKYSLENGLVTELRPLEEHVASAQEPFFHEVTAFDTEVAKQLSRGIPYWRSRLDPASGIDLYGNQGIAVGDVDGDGVDEIYVCQAGGLPNRLLKFDERGVLRDIGESWGANILDDTSSALFLDLRNSGRQDLVVLRSAGPVLLLNEGKRFRIRDDAFRFSTPPQGGFTGMAAADFDRDGKLDLYLCCYVYFQSEAQYTYASPYHDAQNGPPNFLFRNKLNADGSGAFEDCTAETGMSENNNRFSFSPAWCDFNGDGWPDLYVANDFGRKNLYVNSGGHFKDKSVKAGVEDIGPGMSAAWFDYDHDGHPDLYVSNMWTDAGQRVIADRHFAPAAAAPEAYRRHTMGNTLFRNRGNGTFEDVTAAQHTAFGRWAWGADGIDFDLDGEAELFTGCGMLSNESETDLGGFFWRQVVAKSPVTAQPSAAYENGWNAINQFIREDYSWSGREPNVLHARRGGRYYDFSGVSGLDFADDTRAFAVCDFDGDGRPDIILKNRLGPQLRVMQNQCAKGKQSIGFDLRGSRSNRDAIGARVQVDGQTKWLSAGSGFLSQHSKRLLFGLGERTSAQLVQVMWPSGLKQEFSNLATGKVYTLVEGSAEHTAKPFRPQQAWPTQTVEPDNSLKLEDTWLMEPVPLPEKRTGPGLFVIDKPSGEYEIFRRYLFDWRAPLQTPFALLLNAAAEVVKVYGATPTASQVEIDLRHTGDPLPFRGFYVGHPRRDFFKFGAAFLWSGYSEPALPYLERVLERTPGNARVIVLVGQIHLQADRLDAAEKRFQAALSIQPGNAEGWSGLADVQSARKEYEPAAASYSKALKLKPDLIYTLLNAGQLADKLEQVKRAEELYRRALDLNPQQPEAANGLGLALAKQGQLPEAKELFQRAISLKRDYADAVNNLAVLYIKQDKLDDAMAAFEYGITAAPDDDILYLNLARLYMQRGKPERARQAMQKLLERKPDSATARRALEELNGR